MKRMLMTLLIATVVCVVPVNAQIAQCGRFVFNIPDEYEGGKNNYFSNKEKGGIGFKELTLGKEYQTEDEYKELLESYIQAATKGCYDYTTTYYVRDDIHFIKTRYSKDDDIWLTAVVASDSSAITIHGLNECADFDEIVDSAFLIK